MVDERAAERLAVVIRNALFICIIDGGIYFFGNSCGGNSHCGGSSSL